MFNDNTQVTPAVPDEGVQSPQPTNSSSQFDTMLSGIVNERGEPKYRTVEDGLRALKHAQEHITTLTADRARLEQERNDALAKSARAAELEETVQKLTRRAAEPEPQAPQYDEETIANIVDTRLTYQQQQAAALANQKVVAGKLSEVYGDKARDLFYEKATTMGFTPAEFEALAAKSPQAVLTMLNIDSGGALKQPNKSPVSGTVATDAFQSRPSSFIGAETEKVPLGGGERHFSKFLDNSRQMVEELGTSGMTVHDLTNPTNYFKYFKK